jgi:hypothetical protein
MSQEPSWDASGFTDADAAVPALGPEGDAALVEGAATGAFAAAMAGAVEVPRATVTAAAATSPATRGQEAIREMVGDMLSTPFFLGGWCGAIHP